ncbi:MAG TPA: NAD(P)H-hydrate dehydratase [Bacteroidota bacterium]|nr:NAD(P)H-hydrate dehydratase [Bacteroidota bacterium]
MEAVVTASTMQACDRFAIQKLKIPAIVLMENAGRGVADAITRNFGSLKGKTVLIFCGKGNNGGDGFVAARHLQSHNCRTIVALSVKKARLRGDAKSNFAALENIGKQSPRTAGVLKIMSIESRDQLSMLPPPDIIVDAIFGTGFRGEVRGIEKDIVEWINLSSARKISIDVPSGLDSDTGNVENVAVRAAVTATMGLRKIGLTLNQGMDYSGLVEVVDLGFSPGHPKAEHPPAYIARADDVKMILPKRERTAHKHSVGKILVLAGSRGLTGAAAMTAASAMRAGAGAVVLGTPSSVYSTLSKKLTEVMVEPFPDTAEGTLSLGAFESAKRHFEWADLLILGPGLSRNDETRQLIRKIVAECDLPMLIDADALNALADKPSVLKKHRSRQIILTPHAGEFARLTSSDPHAIGHDRLLSARRMAKEFKVSVVFKGAPTVTVSEDGTAVINTTGNAGMATAGSGDVLSGLIGGLWGQGMDRFEAAWSGVFLHGYAGDLAKEKFGEQSMLASDIQEFIPEALTCHQP